MENKMIDANHQLLGENEVLLRPWDEIEGLFDKWDEMIMDVGCSFETC
jgi:hypothetical protein